jgi:hypothetical protein
LGSEPVDVVLALNADTGVLGAGDELDELVVVVTDVAARVGGREDIVDLANSPAYGVCLDQR